MLEILEMGIGLEVVQAFQTLRFGLLDSLALLFHFANDGLFYVIVIGAIYWTFDKRLGMRMLFALLLIGMVTLIFKEILARPRPYQIIGSGIIPLVTETSYGIPSAHASMTFVIWGYFAVWMKQRIITSIVIIYIILMGLSRMYLGVHFPQSIIAGWLLGGIVLWLYVRYVEQVVRWWHRQPMVIELGVPIAIGILSGLFFLGNIDGLTLVGLLFGVSIAVVIETHYVHFDHKTSRIQRIAQFIFGLVIAVAILEGLDIIFDAIEPPTYTFVEDNVDGITALQAEANIIDGTALEVCTFAETNGLDKGMTNVCEVQVTPLSAGLRIIRYTLLAIFAISIIPLISIQINLMERKPANA